MCNTKRNDEIWKPVPIDKFNDFYEVSNKGRVKSYHNGIIKILKPFKVGKYRNYLAVRFYDGVSEKGKDFKVHRLVTLAFIPNPDNLPQVNHKDGNTFNNNIKNLEWCDNSENQTHAWKMGLNHLSDKSFNPANVGFIGKCECSKPVVQFDLDYNPINIFGSIASAESITNSSSIEKCCGYERKHANNYRWRFLSECILRNKIIVLSAKSASGKNHIINKLKEIVDINELISCTTRPKRQGEIDGKTYYYVSENEFISKTKNAEMLNVRRYKTEYGIWYYGLELKEIYKDNPICILDMEGLKNLKEKLGKENIISIYIDADENVRRKRYLQRDVISDLTFEEMERRFKADERDFNNDEINNEYDYIFKNNNEEDLKVILNSILKIINDNLKDKPFNIFPRKMKKGTIRYNNKYFDEIKQLCDFINVDHTKVIILINRKNFSLNEAVACMNIFNNKTVTNLILCVETGDIFNSWNEVSKLSKTKLGVNISRGSVTNIKNSVNIKGFSFKKMTFKEYYNDYKKDGITYELEIF